MNYATVFAPNFKSVAITIYYLKYYFKKEYRIEINNQNGNLVFFRR